MAELTDDQQERLDRLRAALCQGDLVHLTPLATVGSPESTIQESVKLAKPFAEYGLATIEWRAASGLWAIVTQTCDIRRAPDVEPFLHPALVLDVTEEEWTAAEGGRSSTRRFAYPGPIDEIERPVLDVRVRRASRSTHSGTSGCCRSPMSG